MSKSLIYCVNGSSQNVLADGTVNFGTIIRRYGCNLNLVGEGVEVRGGGYYSFLANIVLAPAAAGEVTATLYKDGVQIPGAIATTTVAAADDVVTLSVPAVIREKGCCDGASAVTCRLSAEAEVTNASIKGDRQ